MQQQQCTRKLAATEMYVRPTSIPNYLLFEKLEEEEEVDNLPWWTIPADRTQEHPHLERPHETPKLAPEHVNGDEVKDELERDVAYIKRETFSPEKEAMPRRGILKNVATSLQMTRHDLSNHLVDNVQVTLDKHNNKTVKKVTDGKKEHLSCKEYVMSVTQLDKKTTTRSLLWSTNQKKHHARSNEPRWLGKVSKTHEYPVDNLPNSDNDPFQLQEAQSQIKAKLSRAEKREQWLEDQKRKRTIARSLSKQLRDEVKRNKSVSNPMDLKLHLLGGTYMLMDMNAQQCPGVTSRVTWHRQ